MDQTKYRGTFLRGDEDISFKAEQKELAEDRKLRRQQVGLVGRNQSVWSIVRPGRPGLLDGRTATF